MKNLLFLLTIVVLFSCNPKTADQVEMIDLHIHLKGDLTIEEAIKKSEAEGVRYGIAVNCGVGFPVQNDAQIDSFVAYMSDYPQFFLGMQAEGREWVDMFSAESLDKFDYVFTDAMTFTDAQGRRNRIWIEEETWVDDDEEFMDYLVETAVTIITNEPIDIYVNPTYLPKVLEDRYDELWTEVRMQKVIDAAKAKGVAIEINNRFEIPSEKFISMAKAAGVKFTIGTNNIDKNFPPPLYAKAMIEKCGLTGADFWIPEMKR